MWIYKVIDLITTIAQVMIFFVVGETLCRKFRNKFSKWLTPAIGLIYTFLWTWIIVDTTYKLPCLLVISIFSYLLCYKVDIRSAIMAAFIALIIIGIVENVTLLIADIFNFSQTTIIDGVPMASIPIYLLCLFLTLLSIFTWYLLFKNFHYQMTNRDFIVVLLFEVTTFLFLHLGTVYRANNFVTGEYNDRIDTLMLAIGVSFTVVFLYIKNNYYLREQEQQSELQLSLLQQQYQYYQEKQKDEEKVRSIYHDMKNHLLVLEGSQGTDATRKMAEQLRLQIVDYEDYVHTGNDFLDVILKDKAEKMREKEIDFSAVIDFGDVDFIEPLDISTIFGNALDNAIEASEKLLVSQRMVTVKAACIRNMLVISVVNNVVAETVITEKTTKPDGFLHGFGLSNIRQSAEKYGGTCTTEQEDERFVLKILLPVAERKAVE